MRIAIVHDWLVTYAGAERVLEQLLLLYPEADLFSLVDFLPDDGRGFIQGKRARTSFIQKLPFARGNFRNYLGLMPLAVEQFDLGAYDLIISSSHAVAKGVLVGPDQLHLCMCYSPMRYAWDFQHQYLRESGLDKGLKSWMVRRVLHRLRIWDVRTANGVDEFVAISQFIARRIHKAYRRGSTLIYPPVAVERFELCTDKEDFYLTASRLVPYKRVDLLVEAFNRMPDKRLVVIGSGPQLPKIRGMAGPNVEVLGYQPEQVLQDHLRRARAFVYAAEEDFGISPVEAQACGTPVIAYGRGGVAESVRGLGTDDPTGVFFAEQSEEGIRQAVAEFEANRARISALACRENAARFAPERFRREFRQFAEEAWAAFSRRRAGLEA